MKKTLIALAVAALAATSANAVVVYDQENTKVELNGSVRLALQKLKDHRWDLANDGSRISLSASHKFADDVRVLAGIEVRPDLDSGGLLTEQLYAGVSYDSVGTFTLGRQTTVADDFGVSDVTYMFGGPMASFSRNAEIMDKFEYIATEAEGILSQMSEYVETRGIEFEDLPADVQNMAFATRYMYEAAARSLEYFDFVSGDNFATKGQKVAKFISRDFNGFKFGASYGFGEASKSEEPNRNYSVGLFYDNTFNDVNILAELGYTHYQFNRNLKANSVKTGFGVGYAGAFLGVDYATTKVTDKKGEQSLDRIHAFQIGASYQVIDPVKVYGAYRYTKTKFDTALSGVQKVKEKAYALGVGYKPHSNVETFVEYNSYKLMKAKRDNRLYVGLRVHF